MAHYEVWRQDDNGREFLVGAWSTREEAEQEQRDLERHGHKQSYYVVVVPEEADASEPVRSGR